MNQRLDPPTLNQAVRELAARDADLARIISAYGPPPRWEREPGFPTLIHIILEQQVSLASAKAAFDRLKAAVEPLTPTGFLTLSDEALKQIGFSRQKTRYGRELAEAVIKESLDLAGLEGLDDQAAREKLIQVKGIGNWTADIYLLMAMGRPDIWPRGDLALEMALQRMKRLAKRPTPEEARQISESWRPWRAVAARILWHFYLSERII
jgi:DNA-3-methyladenine glycosylase II